MNLDVNPTGPGGAATALGILGLFHEQFGGIEFSYFVALCGVVAVYILAKAWVAVARSKPAVLTGEVIGKETTE